MEIKQRLEAAIDSLLDARTRFDEATRDLDHQRVDDGANWSILDHVRHASHPGAYPKWIRGLATDASFHFPDQSGPGGYWRWTRENALAQIDEQIAFARTLSEWQLSRKAKLGPREQDVIDLLQGMANHYRDHAATIRRLAGRG